jgi:hypothetical protein
MAALAIILLLWYGSNLTLAYAKLNSRKTELTSLQEQIKGLDDVVKQVEELEQEKNLAEKKEQAVVMITSGRTVWSHELYVLAGLVPPEIWLENVEMTTRSRPVTIDVPNPDRKTNQTQPTIKKTVMRNFPALRITGFALSPNKEKGVRLVGTFINNITYDEVFSRHFISPEMRTIEREKFNDETVMKFVVDVEITN